MISLKLNALIVIMCRYQNKIVIIAILNSAVISAMFATCMKMIRKLKNSITVINVAFAELEAVKNLSIATPVKLV